MRAFVTAIIGAILIAPVTSPAKTMDTAMVGNWLVGAYSDDKSGEFSHCAMAASYRSGIYMVFSLNNAYQWTLGFADPEWRLTKGATVAVGMTIDHATPILDQATAITPTQVEIPLPQNNYLFDRFRRGYQLQVRALGRVYYFNLNSTSRALAALLNCTRHYAGRG